MPLVEGNAPRRRAAARRAAQSGLHRAVARVPRTSADRSGDGEPCNGARRAGCRKPRRALRDIAAACDFAFEREREWPDVGRSAWLQRLSRSRNAWLGFRRSSACRPEGALHRVVVAVDARRPPLARRRAEAGSTAGPAQQRGHRIARGALCLAAMSARQTSRACRPFWLPRERDAVWRLTLSRTRTTAGDSATRGRRLESNGRDTVSPDSSGDEG